MAGQGNSVREKGALGREPSEFMMPLMEALERRILLDASVPGEVGGVGGGAGDCSVDLLAEEQYMLYDHWGGTWHDAEKGPASDDDLMCWANASANILTWTGWGAVDGMTTADQNFQYFKDHWTNQNGDMLFATNWWFDGSNNQQGVPGWAQVHTPGGGSFSYETWRHHWHTSPDHADMIDMMEYAEDFLRAGYGTALMLNGPNFSSHTVTCWGYSYLPTNPVTYVGVWITDSDDDQSDPTPPDTLDYYEVEYISYRDGWYLRDYDPAPPGEEDDFFISSVRGLAGRPFPDRPIMDVRANGRSITNGDLIPSAWDHTSFGRAQVDGGAVRRTFTIVNVGTETLQLAGNEADRVVIADSPTPEHTEDFEVVSYPPASLAMGEEATFSILFTPGGQWHASAEVRIANNASVEPFEYGISGDGERMGGLTSMITEYEKLLAGDSGAYDCFGEGRVAIDGEWAIVGEPDHQSGDGAAFIFRRDGPLWREFQLIPPEGHPQSWAGFGAAVDISGNRAVVGMPYADGDTGRAFVFAYDQVGDEWVLDAHIWPPDPAMYDEFGRSVAIDGDHLLIGCPGRNTDVVFFGAVYAYWKEGTTWRQSNELLLGEPFPGSFGTAVAMDDGWAVIGAPGTWGQGRAYMFELDPGGQEWTIRESLDNSGIHGDDPDGARFGAAVAIHDGRVIVGAPNHGLAWPNQIGAACIHEYSGSSWPRVSEFYGTDLGDRLGRSVAINGDWAVAGAPQPSDDAGEGMLYFRDEGAWSTYGQLKASDGDGWTGSGGGDEVGHGVALSSPTPDGYFWAMVTAPWDDWGERRDFGSLLTYRLCRLPDLFAMGFDVEGSTNVVAGDQVAVVDYIYNGGPEDAPPFTVEYYLSGDQVIGDAGDLAVGQTLAAGGIPAYTEGGPYRFDITLPARGDPFWSGDGAHYYVGMVLDTGDDVTEFDEANNANLGRWRDSERIYVYDDPYERNDAAGEAYYPGYNWEDTWLSAIDGVGVQFDEDWYRIEVSQYAPRVKAECTFTHADGDINLALCDGGGNPIAEAASLTDDEQIDHVVPGGGVYYLKVYGAGAGNTYDLWWDDLLDDDYEENDTREEAYDFSNHFLHEWKWLSTVSGPGVQADEDWYEIAMTAEYRRLWVECTFHHAQGDINVELYDEAGLLLTDSSGTSDDETFCYTVPESGAYYVRIVGPNNRQGYDLRWHADALVGVDFDQLGGARPAFWGQLPGGAWAAFNDTRGETGAITPYDLDISTSGSGWDTFPASIDASTLPAHWQSLAGLSGYIYEFASPTWTFEWSDLTPQMPYRVYVFGLRAYDGANDVSIDGLGPPVTFDQVLLPNELHVNGETGDSSRALATFAEIVRADASGRIVIEVTAGAGTGGPTLGGLAIQPLGDDDYEENDTRGEAHDLSGDEQTWLSAISGAGVQADDDWYRISMTTGYQRLRVDCTFAHAEGDVNVEVYSAAGVLMTGSYSTTDNETFEYGLPMSGTYYLKVIGPGNGQAYDLKWDDFRDDAYEQNDVRGQAFDLGDKEQTWLTDIHGWGMQFDADWYEVEVSPAGYEHLLIDLNSSHAQGNLDLYLYDASGSLLASSTSKTDDEHISYVVSGPGSYYVLVVGPGSGQPYDLWWDDLQPGRISGRKFHDLDGDGARDAGEPGLEGWKIYVDENRNGGWNTGEPYALTDHDGDYVITGVRAGDCVVREVPRDGWEQTFPVRALVGIDFDQAGGTAPGNWTLHAGGPDIALTDLIDESGGATPFDLAVSASGSSMRSAACTPEPTTLPIHMQPLTGLSGYVYEGAASTWTFEWSDLTPQAEHDVYVFGLRAFDGTNHVVITGANAPIAFDQVLTADELAVNDDTGHSGRQLASFAEVVTSDVSGRIAIEVTAGPGASAVALGGLAIQPVTLGVHTVVLSPGEIAGGMDFGNRDVDPPTVVDVLVAGTGWDEGYLDFLAAESMGSGGYSIPVGSDAQLDELPWVNTDQIKIVFSEGVDVTQDDLAVYGVAVPQYTSSGFAYDSGSRMATWTLAAPVEADKLLLVLSDDVTDVAGNALDGEWTDEVSSYPSGDGAAGGDFHFRFNALPGDVDQSGEVRSSDTIKVRRKSNTVPGDADYSVFYDVDGNGEIRAGDTIKVRRLSNTELPDGEPVAPPAAPLGGRGGDDELIAAALRAARRTTDRDLLAPTAADVLSLAEIVPLAI